MQAVDVPKEGWALKCMNGYVSKINESRLLSDNLRREMGLLSTRVDMMTRNVVSTTSVDNNRLGRVIVTLGLLDVVIEFFRSVVDQMFFSNQMEVANLLCGFASGIRHALAPYFLFLKNNLLPGGKQSPQVIRDTLRNATNLPHNWENLLRTRIDRITENLECIPQQNYMSCRACGRCGLDLARR